MKNIFFPLIILLLIVNGCSSSKTVADKKSSASPVTAPVAQSNPKEVNFSDPTTWLLGYINPGQLAREPYSEWYLKGFDDYVPNSESFNKLLDKDKTGLTIKIVMGTWCPDSRREVPRLMKVLDTWQFPSGKVTIIGVDNAKHSPVGEYVNLDIQRVPTIIIYKNNIEAGRIIENPTTSLEQDIVNILTRNEK
jgi:thiol-disulfide isomerase/thioredoxin